jgi:hypothetical protein
MIADPKEGDLVKILYGTYVGYFGRIVRVVPRRGKGRPTLIYIAVKGATRTLFYWDVDLELA